MGLRPIIKNKKGFTDFTSLIFALAVIFGISIFLVILNHAYGQVKPRLAEGLEDSFNGTNSEQNVSRILDQAETTILRFDLLFPLLLIGIFAFVMVTAFMENSHPIFFFIGILILGVVLMLSGIFSNVYDEITDNSQFAGSQTDFSIMTLFLENLPIIMLILFVGITIILFSIKGGALGY